MGRIEKHTVRIQDNKGFSLVELLVGLAVFSLVGLVLTHQLTFGSRVNTKQSAVARAQQSLRAARLMINQDIRLAGLDPRVTFGFGFEEATPTKFRVTADLDGDGVVDNSGAERVTYEIPAGARELQKILYEGTASQVTAPLLDRVDPTASGFVYLDANDLPIASPVAAAQLDNIRAVVVNLSVEEVAGREGIVNRESSGRVLCRNMGI
jgi:prepilin-type N-terminal cleavage/methylation domain-containing protein